MNRTKAALYIATLLFSVSSCSQPVANQTREESSQREEPATFVNHVWRVAESSSAAPGQLGFAAVALLLVALGGRKDAAMRSMPNGR